MTRRIEPAKPKLKHLMVLKRMVEEHLGLCLATHGMSSAGYTFFHRDQSGWDAGSHDWFRMHIDGRLNLSGNFYNWGWINAIAKPPEEKDSGGRAGIFAWYDKPYLLTRQGRDYWITTGETEYNRLTQIEADQRAKVERLVAIRKLKSYHRDGDRLTGMLVRVIRETDSRLYIEAVDGVSCLGGYEFMQGRGGNYFIDRDQVTLDGVTQEKYAELVAVENHIQAERRALQDEEVRAIQDVRDRFKDRKIQTQAEYDSRIRGVLG
jgi:hypothetical protein